MKVEFFALGSCPIFIRFDSETLTVSMQMSFVNYVK